MNLTHDFRYHVMAPGERAAGLHPFTEEIHIHVKYGIESDPDSIKGFDDAMKAAIAEYYDCGAKVLTDAELEELNRHEAMEFTGPED